MRVRVLVTPRAGVLDPEGRAVLSALRDLGYRDASEVRTGRVILVDLATDDPARARAEVREMCEKLLANPVIEDYEVELLDGAGSAPGSP
ncbi:MAG: phosphoribosylformylglycinamidine synthase subunit PurS [Myxococcota bacterium]